MTDREYHDYLQDILLAITSIQRFVVDYDLEKFEADEKTVWAVIRGPKSSGRHQNIYPIRCEKNIPKYLGKTWL